MNINVTIIVQAVNFAIVYWLLRTFLFRPVIKVIDTELSDKGLLLDRIHHHKKVIENQEDERERLWRSCREYFRLNKPYIHQQRVLVDIYKEVDYTSDSSNVIELIKEIQRNLEEKIKHVH
jgi:hypothetical protein